MSRNRRLRILILGGTVFLGRALVEAALFAGYSVTLFNRGQSNPGLFPHVEQVHGDRDGGLQPLAGRAWDAVIDTCGYLPRLVRQSARLLSGSTGLYVFISSISVYADTSRPGIEEGYPVGRLQDESVEQITAETYGPLKALCEQALQEVAPTQSLIIRPGLIVGPHDPSDRFTYWPMRVARGGSVLAPGRPQRGIQFIDVRDLAEWILRMAAAGRSGVYNADGPPGNVSMGGLLEICREVSGSDAAFAWVDDSFLVERQVGAWIEMPLWIPETDLDSAGFFSINVTKALEAGLTYRPLADTVQATLAWASSRPADHAWRAGLAPEREKALISQR